MGPLSCCPSDLARYWRQLGEKTMLEYDQNLPQEFAHKPKRVGTGLLTLVLALAAGLLVYALIAILPLISRHQI